MYILLYARIIFNFLNKEIKTIFLGNIIKRNISSILDFSTNVHVSANKLHGAANLIAKRLKKNKYNEYLRKHFCINTFQY